MNRTKRIRPRALVVLICIAALVLSASGSAWAVDIQGIREGSTDLPFVNMMLQPAAGGDPYGFEVFPGYTYFNIGAILDTGTSGIVVTGDEAFAFDVPLEDNDTFFDTAVGGLSPYWVTAPINIGLAPSNSLTAGDISQYQTAYTIALSSVRVEAGPQNPDPEQFQFDVAGMPVLAGKTMVLDVRGANAGTDYLRTYVYGPGAPAFNGSDTDPGIPTTSHHVATSYADFSSFTSVDPLGAPPPALAHNPFIGANPLDPSPPANSPPGVSVSYGGLHASGSFLFDSGDQVAFISSNIASQLHVRYVAGTEGTTNPQLETFNPSDPNDTHLIDSQFVTAIQGLTGSVFVAGFDLDSLTLHTVEGSAVDSDPNNLNFLGRRLWCSTFKSRTQTATSSPSTATWG